MDAGYLEEAKAWREWLSRAAAGTPDQLQIMYGVAGERSDHNDSHRFVTAGDPVASENSVHLTVRACRSVIGWKARGTCIKQFNHVRAVSRAFPWNAGMLAVLEISAAHEIIGVPSGASGNPNGQLPVPCRTIKLITVRMVVRHEDKDIELCAAAS
jgi:hypothetical protein